MPSTLKQVVDRIKAAKTEIANAITAKGGTVGANDGLEEFASDIATIPSGGSSSSNDVNFYDYDGTIVQSYSAAEFANLSALPSNPTHTGLTAQSWNWTLVDAKTYVASYGKLNIGQMYTTSDGKTRIYIKLSEGRTAPLMMLYLNDNTELDIDWGDDSTHSTWTTTSADYKSERHSYPNDGEYVIVITVVSGSFVFQSQSESYNTFFTDGKNNSSSSDRAYLNSIQKIKLGIGVTTIGNYAFQYCSSLSSITIPDSVTSIGSYAFNGCTSLSSITIPDGVTSIGNNAFTYCYSLSSITIPDSVTSISDYTFYNCYSLSSITIPNGVTSIGTYAFQSCYSLSSITIPDSVTSIGNNAFQSCYSLSSITIPDGVTSIGSNTFTYCYSLSSITIPNGVTSIGGSVFQNCSSLSSITIPDGVTSIGSSAFRNCSYMSYIKFKSTTPPTVLNLNAWQSVSRSTKILVPTGTLNTYKTATNYPNPSTYTYEEY